MANLIIDLLEKSASLFLDKTAISDQQRSITFRQLKAYAISISKKISTIGSQAIGVIAHRDLNTIPLFFGIALNGGCYIPLDPDAPIEKLEKIIKNSGLTHIVSCHSADQATVEASGADFFYINPDIPPESISEPIAPAFQENLLYVIYTSGSTGEPKGVAKSHNAMKNFIEAYTHEFSFDANTIIGNQTPFYFDASAKDIYLMLATGATLEIIPTMLFSFPIKLIEYMDERKINFISWVPSALSIVTALHTFRENKPKYLKRVFFVGEVFPVKHLNRWMEALPHLEFVNLYGSSEICGISLFYRIKSQFDLDSAIPIGKALSNCDVKLVNNHQVITEAEKVGEIYIASEALADGYYKNPKKTASAFLSIDLGEGIKRYYKSGDIAKYNENGDLVFAARTDHQIKHMGHRIELGEIEAAANAINGVEKCCCLYHAKRQRIILYIQPEANAEITDTEIRSLLKKKLSDYMLPHRYVIKKLLPLNPNGKIDRTTLAKDLKE